MPLSRTMCAPGVPRRWRPARQAALVSRSSGCRPSNDVLPAHRGRHAPPWLPERVAYGVAPTAIQAWSFPETCIPCLVVGAGRGVALLERSSAPFPGGCLLQWASGGYAEVEHHWRLPEEAGGPLERRVVCTVSGGLKAGRWSSSSLSW